MCFDWLPHITQHVLWLPESSTHCLFNPSVWMPNGYLKLNTSRTKLLISHTFLSHPSGQTCLHLFIWHLLSLSLRSVPVLNLCTLCWPTFCLKGSSQDIHMPHSTLSLTSPVCQCIRPSLTALCPLP